MNKTRTLVIIASAYFFGLLLLVFSRFVIVTAVAVIERTTTSISVGVTLSEFSWLLLAVYLVVAIIFWPIVFFEQLGKLQFSVEKKVRTRISSFVYLALLILFVADYFLADRSPLIYAQAGVCRPFVILGIVSYLVCLSRSFSALRFSGESD